VQNITPDHSVRAHMGKVRNFVSQKVHHAEVANTAMPGVKRNF